MSVAEQGLFGNTEEEIPFIPVRQTDICVEFIGRVQCLRHGDNQPNLRMKLLDLKTFEVRSYDESPSTRNVLPGFFVYSSRIRIYRFLCDRSSKHSCYRVSLFQGKRKTRLITARKFELLKFRAVST